MGVKFFYTWVRRQYADVIYPFSSERPGDVPQADVFMIDLNGIFHAAAQRVYEYGNFAKPKVQGILRPKRYVPLDKASNDKLLKLIGESIDALVHTVRPKKTLVLAIDGVAPMAKINQQRQRRYRGAVEEPETYYNKSTFDSVSITPGTKFMDTLGKYLEVFVRKQIATDSVWRKLDVVLSSDKCPGEGEHKLINYVRAGHVGKDDVIVINALDADLVMLSMGLHRNNVYLLRELTASAEHVYEYIDIAAITTDLVSSAMSWTREREGQTRKQTRKQTVEDFILLSFLCGNDFLPTVPSISILEGGLDAILDVYRIFSEHLTCNGEIIPQTFARFLHALGHCEKGLLERKCTHLSDYISDPVLEAHVTLTEKSDENRVNIEATLDLNAYKSAYYISKGMDARQCAHAYAQGCAWVLWYYLHGVKDWTWVYPFNYAPFCCDLALTFDAYIHADVQETEPLLPFEQLLLVVPPKSADLLPEPLAGLLGRRPLADFCPEKFKICYDGKKFKYEGIIELPVPDTHVFLRAHRENVGHVSDSDKKRNVRQESQVLWWGDEESTYVSSFGKVRSNVMSENIHI